MIKADNNPADESFISRWSRLKRESRSDSVEEVVGDESIKPDAAAANAQAAPLPSIDDLDERSDFSAFLDPAVDEELRRLALRKLFRLPEFNRRDGLNEYDEDYTAYQALGTTVTTEMKRAMELTAARMENALVVSSDGDNPGPLESDESLAPEEADAGLAVDSDPDSVES